VTSQDGEELLKDPVPPRLPLAAPAWPETVQDLPSVKVEVSASEPGDLATGITLWPGCDIQIDVSGTIKWDGLFDPRNGPEGLPGRLVNDVTWPLHTGLDRKAQAYGLLGRLNNYFRIGPDGTGLPRTKWTYPEERPLFLRLNHIFPSKLGDGRFTVTIKVWAPEMKLTGNRNQPLKPSDVFRPVNVLRDGGVLRTTEPGDLIEVTVTQGAVAPNVVEFELSTPATITWRKEIAIRESPSQPTPWTIYTKADRHSDRNGLYDYQLAGATLTFLKDSLGMRTVCILPDLSAALPGSRITFNWVYDSYERPVIP
jgi:hypothetical protein